MLLKTKNIRYAHSDGHTDVCYGSDYRQLLTCGSDGNVRIWDGSDDDDPSADSVSEAALCVACGKDHFFVATDNNYVQSFTYPEKIRDKVMLRFSAPVTHISISHSGKLMGAGSCDMEIQVLNMETNKITTLRGHNAPILSVSLDPLDEYLASSSCDGTVKIWQIKTGSIVKTFFDVVPKKNDFFKAISLGRTAWKSLSGSLLAVPLDLEVIIYKRDSWEIHNKLTSEKIETSLSAVIFSPCGNYLAGASSGGEIVVWEAKHNSEVCYFKDPKKTGISGIAWRPDGSEIAFTDRLGRLSVLVGINEEISKHMSSKETESEQLKVNSTTEDINTNALFNYDDDDDDDNENCISLEKIKAGYKNEGSDDHESDDNEAPGSPCSTATGNLPRESVLPYAKPQAAFQPSSTPSNFEPRCLCYNSVGLVRYYEEDKTIDVQFHDTLFHHALYIRSFGLCTMASLSMNVLCLAVASLEENPSKLSCIPLSSWGGSKEWTVYMPQCEDIVALAAAGSWVAVATNFYNLRVFSHAGTQKQVLALPGPAVCLSGYEQKLLVICHMGLGMLDNQNEGFILYRISNLYVKALTPFQPLPLFPKSVLNWVGFTDEGTPCAFDSEGLLRLLSHDNLHWEVCCDLRNQRKSPSDHYFIIGISEKYQNVRCVLCRNSRYPLVINTPTVLEIPLKLPLCALDAEKSIQEETFWRFMFSLYSLEKLSEEKCEAQDEISAFEQTLKQTALKLFAEACRNSEDMRALDVATFMSKQPLELAVKYSSKAGKMYLAEKLNGIVPVEWKNHFSEAEHCFVRQSTQQKSDNTVYSQQDLFEEYPVPVEKENKPVEMASQKKMEPESPEIIKVPPVNPFKKAQISKNEGPKGLSYFDSLVVKEAPKVSKTQFQSKPLKLKYFGSKDKISEGKTKKPTFVQWFSTRKTCLSEEYPSLSASELTKLGMKLYKEEMNRGGNEDKLEEESELEVVKSKKRALEIESESESETKRNKGLEHDF